MKYCKKAVGEGREFERIRRITGYLTGTLDGWNSAKRAEEKDRVIDRILIYELDKNTNTRKIEIFYSFVGKVDTGEQPTESVSYFRQIGADVKSVVI